MCLIHDFYSLGTGPKSESVRPCQENQFRFPNDVSSTPFATFCQSPELYGAIFAAGRQPAPAKIESDGIDRMVVPGQRLHFPTCSHIPELDRLIPTARG